MVGLNVWGKGAVKMLCALIGLGVGYAAAAATGLFGAEQVASLADTPWIGLPRPALTGWSFDITIAVTFAIASLAAAMKAVVLLPCVSA
jgi:xanthine permease XanP